MIWTGLFSLNNIYLLALLLCTYRQTDTNLKNLLYLNRYLLKYKWYLTTGTIFVTLSNYFGILIPQKIGSALDFVKDKIIAYKVASGAEAESMYEVLSEALLIFGLTVIGFSLIKGFFMYMMRQTIIVTSRLIEYDLRKEIFDHLEKLDTAVVQSQKTGDLMSRITEDVSKVRNYLGPGILYGINLTTLVIMTVYAMFRVNFELAMYTLLPLPILSYSIYWVSSRINIKSAIIQKQLGKLGSIATETYSGIRVIKSYGKEEQFNQYFDEQSEDYRLKSMDLVKINALFYPLMILLVNISTILVLFIGGQKISTGTISYGNIAEFIIYVNMLTWPVTAVGWIASVIQQAEASQERINELLSVKPKILSGNESLENIRGKVNFKRISFTYKDTGIQAIKDFNVLINPGEKIAIIGKTASGKSTIAELLLRMYDVDTGAIELDDLDIKKYNLSELRRKIGYVPQDVFLFSDTVHNNIAFGVGEADKALVKEMAENAAVREDLEQLPEGFETKVGERGVTLSGGQKQRVSIARAFIKDPNIVILDDCLSAVDTETEQKILNYLRTACKGKTTIVITHRVSGIFDFDKIIVMDEGKIIESGIPADLANDKNSYYSGLLQEAFIEP